MSSRIDPHWMERVILLSDLVSTFSNCVEEQRIPVRFQNVSDWTIFGSAKLKDYDSLSFENGEYEKFIAVKPNDFIELIIYSREGVKNNAYLEIHFTADLTSKYDLNEPKKFFLDENDVISVRFRLKYEYINDLVPAGGGSVDEKTKSKAMKGRPRVLGVQACLICDMMQLTESGLMKHLHERHKTSLPQLDLMFSCGACPYGVLSERAHKVHAEICKLPMNLTRFIECSPYIVAISSESISIELQMCISGALAGVCPTKFPLFRAIEHIPFEEKKLLIITNMQVFYPDAFKTMIEKESDYMRSEIDVFSIASSTEHTEVDLAMVELDIEPLACKANKQGGSIIHTITNLTSAPLVFDVSCDDKLFSVSPITGKLMQGESRTLTIYRAEGTSDVEGKQEIVISYSEIPTKGDDIQLTGDGMTTDGKINGKIVIPIIET